MNPVAYIHRATAPILDFDEASESGPGGPSNTMSTNMISLSGIGLPAGMCDPARLTWWDVLRYGAISVVLGNPPAI